tara:strand:- start:141 stop:1079 length:939 start_codon:yes stop_codon:yes gene_type:complete
MNTAVMLSYKGLGSNLLHLSYCHQIADKYGPIIIITLCENLNAILKDDPKIKQVIYLRKYYKKIWDIFSLSKFLKNLNLENIFIYYPSKRYFWASKLADIKNIHIYNFKKKKLHLVSAAKEFTKKILELNHCPTETRIFVNTKLKEIAEAKKDTKLKHIVLGIGSSGPTTKWGLDNYYKLSKKLSEKYNCLFYILCGPGEEKMSLNLMSLLENKNCIDLSKKKIDDILPIISISDIYIGNDSFGHHVASQCNVPSIIILLDTPRAYSDYSKNQIRILPNNISLDDIDHNSRCSPTSVSVDKVLETVLKTLNN